MTKTPHKHAIFIKAWADGETIEQYSSFHDVWFREFFPSWNEWKTTESVMLKMEYVVKMKTLMIYRDTDNDNTMDRPNTTDV